MHNYDFSTLSPYEFERLARDLLQKHLNMQLESFKLGKDLGIDLRCAIGPDKTIIQCKRFVESDYGDLVRELKKEREKIERLAPTRYILATSLGLLPQQKDAIVNILAPFCSSSADIFAKDDLNNLLAQYQDIERQHFKLWLHSFHVLEQVLGRLTLNLSAYEKQKIEKKRRLYVQTQSFVQACAKLKEHQYCIITGIPGVGKTTLAEMLLLHYCRLGFSIIKVSEDMKEGIDKHDKNQRQIFYYDDFLGQTGLSVKLGKNEDERILSFIEIVRSSPNTRFIMTTREYLLKQTQLDYERLARYQFEKCILEPPSYDRLQRARILYNHLFFSDLPSPYKQAVLSSRTYLPIIEHHGFNPRLIELLTTSSRVKHVPVRNYVSFFMDNLSDPKEIWEHAFSYQISIGAKNVLLVLATMPKTCFLDDLCAAFDSFHIGRAHKYSIPCTPYDFDRALKEIEETFLSLSLSEKHGKLVVSFHNPSVRDYMESHLASYSTDVEEILEFAHWFEQVEFLCGVTEVQVIGRSILSSATSNEAVLAKAFMRTFDRHSAEPYPEYGNYGPSDDSRLSWCVEQRLAVVLAVRDKRMISAELDSFLSDKTDELIRQLEESKFDDEFLPEILNALEESKYEYCSDKRALADAVKRLLESYVADFEHFRFVAECLKSAPSLWYSFEVEQLRKSFLSLFKIEQPGLAESFGFRETIEWIESITAALELDLSVEIEQLQEAHDQLQEEAAPSYSPRQVPKDWKRNPADDETEIHAMFSGLMF